MVNGPVDLGTGNGDTASNAGTVTSSAANGNGLMDVGDDGVLTNSGRIETRGVDAAGIQINGADGRIANNADGEIVTEALNSDGIEVNSGGNTRVDNAGSIDTSGDDADGIDVEGGPDNTVVNTGTITTRGDDADGMEANGNRNTLRNEGRIETAGGDGNIDTQDGSFTGAQGMESNGIGSRVINAATIVTTGGSDGIVVSGDASTAMGETLVEVNRLDRDGQLQALQTASLGTHDELSRASRFVTRQVQSTVDLRLRRLCPDPNPRLQGETRDRCPDEGVWGNVFGQDMAQDRGDDGFVGFDADSRGIALGNDWAAGGGYLGFSTGAAKTDVAFNRGGGDADVDTVYFAGYGGTGGEFWYADAILVFARHQYQQDRQVLIGGERATASAAHTGDEWAANAEWGYDLVDLRVWRLTPFVAAGYSRLHEEGFSESGAGPLNENVEDRDTDSLRSDLGLRLATAMHTDADNRLSAWASAAWSHDYAVDDRTVAGTYEGAPNTRFTLDGRELDRDGAKAEIGLGYEQPNSFRVGLRAGGEFRSHLDRYSAQLKVTKLLD